MSSEDFQAKYATAVESIFRGAVAETTKLFETMFHELKAEMSQIREEVEDLKARCPRETDPLPGRNDGPEKRDTAVQCDLVASHTLLVEQSQPLSFSPSRNQRHHSCEGVAHALQEHDYATCENLGMEITFIKQEQEEVEVTAVRGNDLSDKAGPFVNTPCSNREIPLSQRHEEDQMALELPLLGRYDGLQGPEKQSPEPRESSVIPFPGIKEDMDEESEIHLKISEIGTQCELMMSEKPQSLNAQHQPVVETSDKEQPSVASPQCEGQTPANEQTNVTLQPYGQQLAQPAPLHRGVAYDELSNRFPDVETSSQPEVVRRRRGRPPKRAKRLQRPVQPRLSMNMKEGAGQAPSSVVSSAVETINSPPAASPQATSVTLQDAMLLLEAMNQSVVENVSSSLQRTATPHKTQCGPCVDDVSTQTTSHPFKTHENEDDLPRMELFTTARSANEKPSGPHQTADVTPANEVEDHVKVVTPRQQHTHSLATAITSSSMPSSTQTSLQSPQQHHPLPLITSAAPSRQGNTRPVPRSASSSAADLPLGTPSLSSVAEETYLASSELPSDVTQSTAKSTHLLLETPQHPEMKPISPRLESTEASRKEQSPTLSLTPQPDSTKSLAPSTVSSRQLSSSEESTICASAQIPILSQKRHSTADSLGSSKKNASVLGIRALTETCSSLNTSVWPVQAIPPTFEQKLSCEVRLTRLPFPISTEDSVFVPRLPLNTSWDARFIFKDGTIQVKSTSDNISTQPYVCPRSKETSVATTVHPHVIPEEPKDILEKSSLSSENFATLEELPDIGFVQISTPYSVPQPAFETSAMAVNATEPSVELTSIVDKEIINNVENGGSFPKDAPMGEKEPAILLHSSSITSKNISYPHSQLSKSQFLAQLLMSPVAKDPEKQSSNESVDARPSREGSRTSDKKRLHKKPLMDRHQGPVKTQLQARRTEANPELHIETRPVLENDHPNHINTTSQHSPFSTVTSNDSSTLVGPMVSRCYKDGGTPKRTTSDSSSVSYRMPVAKNESSPANPTRGSSIRRSVGSTNKESSVGSPRRSSSPLESFACKKTQNISVHPRRTRSARRDASPEKGKAGGSQNNTKISNGRQRRTTLSRDNVCPKASASSKNCSSPKTCTNASRSVIRRRFNFTKDSSCAVQIKRKTNSKNTSQTVCPSVGGPKLAKGGPSSKKTRECASVKNPRSIQDAVSPKKTSIVKNTKKLANAKTLAKMRSSKKAGKRCSTTAVWFPPKGLPAAEKNSADIPVQKETPKSQDRPVVYPPSVPLHPIPFRAPPVVSPLQPLSVIGRCLLRNQCGVCGRILNSRAALESHVGLHVGMQPFSCSLCGKSYADSKALKRHDRVHRNGKIHVCQQCGKGFVYKFSLTKHVQMVHRRLKPYVCQICNKGCCTKKDAEIHIRVHTGEKPYHCNLCERKYARRTDLNLHLRWHNGEKRHWCPYCGKGFLHSNNLKRHKYTHTGEKPLSCPHCPKHFSQSGHLKKHVKNVHRLL